MVVYPVVSQTAIAYWILLSFNIKCFQTAEFLHQLNCWADAVLGLMCMSTSGGDFCLIVAKGRLYVIIIINTFKQ